MALVADSLDVRSTTPSSHGALPVSLLLHGLLFAGALWLIRSPPMEAPPDLAGIGVTIIEMQSATGATNVADSDATANMLAAGSVSPEAAEAVKPVRVEVAPAVAQTTLEPTMSAAISPLAMRPEAKAPPVEATTPPTEHAVATQAAESSPVAPEATAAAIPLAEALAVAAEVPLSTPAVVATAVVAPRQMGMTAPQIDAAAAHTEAVAPIAQVEPVTSTETIAPTKPVQSVADPRPRPAVQKSAKAPPDKPEKPQAKNSAAAAGNGGKSSANSAASAARPAGAAETTDGGSAAVSRYPGLVQARLRRALQSQSGIHGGQVQVRFLVAANGNVSAISIVESSGNPALDAAGIATVRRAAPFPPIPAEAGRSTWSFILPLRFR